jgi:hypothetical protein
MLFDNWPAATALFPALAVNSGCELQCEAAMHGSDAMQEATGPDGVKSSGRRVITW